jgi:EmrB/QacA subfamily drug resistance transporter
MNATGPDRRRWMGLAILLTAAFMDLLDGNIVNVAAATIQQDLGATYADIQWIIAGYILACSTTLITGGRMGDIFGRRKMFLIGTAGFTTASLLCALARNPEMLIGARVLQGGMSALMLPQVLAIIHLTFDRQQLGKVVGLYACIAGTAIVGGPVAGGLLLNWNPLGLEWRSIFVLNLPVGMAALAAAPFTIDESRTPHPLRLDLIGAFLVTLGLLLLLYPLSQGRELGWPTWSIASMIASVPLFALFAAYERRRTRKDDSPLIVFSLFRVRGYTTGLLVQSLCPCVITAFFLTWTLYLQLGLGWSPLHTGLTTIPFSAGASIAGGLSMYLVFPRFGRNSLLAGAGMMITGLMIYSWLAGQYGTQITSWEMTAPLLLIGVGLGQLIVPVTVLTLADVPPQHAGAASGVINTTSQLGSALGIALIGVIFFTAIGQETPQSADRAVPRIRQALSAATELSPSAREEILKGFRACTIGQATAHDPLSTPPDCHRNSKENTITPSTRQFLDAAAARAHRESFVRSFQQSLWYILATLIAILALLFTMPKRLIPADLKPRRNPRPDTPRRRH